MITIILCIMIHLLLTPFILIAVHLSVSIIMCADGSIPLLNFPFKEVSANCYICQYSRHIPNETIIVTSLRIMWLGCAVTIHKEEHSCILLIYKERTIPLLSQPYQDMMPLSFKMYGWPQSLYVISYYQAQCWHCLLNTC